MFFAGQATKLFCFISFLLPGLCQGLEYCSSIAKITFDESNV